MNLKSWGIIGAVITALLSTLCCLPAFLFIFFGISGGILTFMSDLTITRIPLAILTIVLLLFSLKKIYSKNISCACDKKQRTISIILTSIFIIIVMFLLFYPELIPLFME